jgi:putative endonuclease
VLCVVGFWISRCIRELSSSAIFFFRFFFVKTYFVYILGNTRRGLTYIGITNDMVRRLWEHRDRNTKGFANRYNLTKLLYLETYDDPVQAIRREKQLKGWVRSRKIELIELENPEWKDLSEEWEKNESLA